MTDYEWQTVFFLVGMLLGAAIAFLSVWLHKIGTK